MKHSTKIELLALFYQKQREASEDLDKIAYEINKPEVETPLIISSAMLKIKELIEYKNIINILEDVE